MSSRRLHPTLADYVVIAINPVLVMGLVGSLIYFLLEVLYQGAYPDRLQFCLTMFIFAIVLISRIAMEDGFEHAAPFGLALAVVVALALNRFVDYGQGSLAHFAWIINWGLMALTWWCAHQLTWDCTVIDDTEEVESQGLLETVGIDKATGQVATAENSATAAENVAAAEESAESAEQRGSVRAGWEQILNRKGRPHAPGVWVVYFSLASLPIFGIGQRFIPADNRASRRYVFGLLCVYVACGLGLLLTTSFLALRRYLRRRRLEMPPIMAGTWLATGGILIVALLLLVALLPRPNPEYAISEVPLRFTSQQHSSSKLAAGEEGTKDPRAQTGQGVDHSRDPAADSKPTDGAGKQPSADARDSAAAAGKSDKPGPAGNGPEKADNAQGSSAGGKSQAKPSPSQDARTNAQQSQSKSDAAKQDPSKTDPSKPDSAKPSEAQSQQAKRDGPSANQKSDRNGAKPSPGSPSKNESSQSPPAAPPSMSLAVGGFLAALFKWILYAVVLGAIGYFGWQSREALLAIVRDWIAQCRAFWASLFGTAKKTVGDVPAPAAILEARRLLRFGDFIDPFDAGSAGQYPPGELVKYTFAALEAWGREHGCQRQLDLTPHEFALQIGQQFQSLASGSRLLADMYCRAVYSAGELPAENLDQVRGLWQVLRSIDAPSAQAVLSDGRERG